MAGSSLAQASEVDNGPGLGVVRVGRTGWRGHRAGRERRRERLRDTGQVRRMGQQGRVVGVVARPEVDRAGGRRHGRERQRLAVPDHRVGRRVGRLDDVSVHQRHDRDRPIGRVARGVDDDQRLVVGVLAVRVPPRSMEGPRGERRGVRVQNGQLVPGGSIDVVKRSPLGDQGAICGLEGAIAAGGLVSARRTRTVGVSLERGGHAARIPPVQG